MESLTREEIEARGKAIFEQGRKILEEGRKLRGADYTVPIKPPRRERAPAKAGKCLFVNTEVYPQLKRKQ